MRNSVARASGLRERQPQVLLMPTDVNRLDNQVLVRYFESEWGRYAVE